jgi:hypothetical protein
MTSRRPIRGHTERVSRALQFIPGHVSGRVASAQPIRRRGGTLRQASVGAVEVPSVAYWLTDTSGGSTGEYWQFVPEPDSLPGVDGYFLVTFAEAEAEAYPSYGIPPGDSVSLAMATAGPYSAGVAYATVAIDNATPDMWFECFSYPATSVQWVPA